MKGNTNDKKEFLDYANLKIKENPVWEMVEMNIASLDWGKAEMRLEIKGKHLNYRGTCHGGIIATLADSVMGLALYAAGAVGATIEMNINFMEPVNKGEIITARSEVLRKGKTTAVIKAELWVADKMVAASRATYFIMEEINHWE